MIINKTPIIKEPTKTTLKGIPSGRAGISATLRIMSKIVKKEKADIRIRELALSIVDGLPAKCWTCEAKAIQRYILNNIRYVRDIDGIETISTPQKTLDYKQGDCDDVSVLAASLLQSIGHPVRFTALGFNGKPLSHVLVETIIGGKWLPMELTTSIPFGQYPGNPTSKLIRNVR